MSFDIGINFRGSSGYVTDGANETYCLGTDTYPTTRGGATFGWDASVNAADRDSGADRRFAGINYISFVDGEFRLDLPSTAEYEVRGAFGDESFQQWAAWLIQDDATQIGATTSTSGGADQYLDATDVNRTSQADWISNNAAITHTFASTILRIVNDQLATHNVLAHLRVVQVEAGGGFQAAWAVRSTTLISAGVG